MFGSAPIRTLTAVLFKLAPLPVALYWQLPERLYDDPEELTGWARAALAAAERAALAKRLRGKRKAVKKKVRRMG